tara:strand:- start:26 stop:178 length:153 start_codon:yes stop_codon:yes gene_type:complete
MICLEKAGVRSKKAQFEMLEQIVWNKIESMENFWTKDEVKSSFQIIEEEL